MKLIWKLTIPQMCLVVCIGLVSFVVIHSQFTDLRNEYIRAAVEYRLQHVSNDIEDRANASVIQASLIVRLPAVIKAYQIALSGNIDNPRSPQSQAARELLRKELAPILDSHEEMTGQKPQIHFHLPNGLSLVRLWREKNTRVDGKWVDISDDLSSYRHTVMDANRSGKAVKGIEPGSGGFAIRGVIPVKTSNGKHLGSAEVVQNFDSLLASETFGEIVVFVYANRELLDFSVTLQDSEQDQFKGDFVRINKAHAFDSLITPELLLRGKTENFYENRGSATLAVSSLNDYSGKQVGVMVCAMNTKTISRFMRTAGIILAFMLACMVMASSLSLLVGSQRMVINPLDKIKAKIRDIVEDRVDLSEQISNLQRDEIGDLARWFNKLTAKVDITLENLRKAIQKNTETEMLLEKEKEFFRTTVDSIGDAVITMNKDGTIVTMNDAAEAITSFKKNYSIGKHFTCTLTLIDGKTRERVQCPIEKSLKEDLSPVISEEYILRAGDSSEKNVAFNCSPILSATSGSALGAVLVFRDISELKKHTEQMEFLSYHDSLTGLYNRAFFDQSCKTLQQNNVFPVTIIMGDANGLKHANDVYGHAAGDIILKTIANAFKSACRSGDIIARWGGDEFVAILPDLTRQRAKKIIQNIHDFCAAANTDPVKASVALGMSTKESQKTLLDDALKTAEKRMYRNKSFMKQNILFTEPSPASKLPADNSCPTSNDPDKTD